MCIANWMILWPKFYDNVAYGDLFFVFIITAYVYILPTSRLNRFKEWTWNEKNTDSHGLVA